VAHARRYQAQKASPKPIEPPCSFCAGYVGLRSNDALKNLDVIRVDARLSREGVIGLI
jgi:hypothetical protein